MKNQPLFTVWEGVYKSFAEAGGDLNGFESDVWIDKQKAKVSNALSNQKNDSFSSGDYPLSLVVAMLLATQGKISVLDFGGGMGLEYLEIINKVPAAKDKLHYYVVEGNKITKNIPVELEKFENLHFFSELDSRIDSIDIVHIGSTLHYIENWSELLHDLTEKYNPKYLIISDVPTGKNNNSFCSLQHFYNSKIPMWFFSYNDFVNKLKEINWLLIYQKSYRSRYFEYLPAEYNLSDIFHLVFKRARG